MSSFGLGAADSLIGGHVRLKENMHVPRDDQTLSAAERLTAIAELFTRGIQRWLVAKRRSMPSETRQGQAPPARNRSEP